LVGVDGPSTCGNVWPLFFNFAIFDRGTVTSTSARYFVSEGGDRQAVVSRHDLRRRIRHLTAIVAR
jgi:hypothetical protein